MPATIESLPIELLAHVATYLDFQPVGSLRLASRTLLSKLSPVHLPQFFAYKNVKLDHGSLHELIYMTCPGRAGCVLQHCFITGVLSNDSDSLALTRLLTDAFVNLKRNSPCAGLVSLRVNVRASPEGSRFNHNEEDESPWSPPQDSSLLQISCCMARQTFETITAALLESQLSVNEYFDVLGGVQGCSLSYRDALPSITHLASTTTVFGSLKKLTLRLSSIRISSVRIPDTYDQSVYSTDRIRQSMHGSSLLQRLLVMLVSMPHLEELDIHWYNFSSLDSDDNLDLDITVPLESPHLKLKDCSLRGLYVAEEDLLRYLKAVRPNNLTLTDIHLIPGSWTSIFEYLSSSISPITSYRLDDLRESDGLLVHFNGMPGQSKFPYRGVQMGPSTLTRQMGEDGGAIRYQTTRRRPLGSPERVRWLRNKRLEFG